LRYGLATLGCNSRAGKGVKEHVCRGVKRRQKRCISL
jgi:hypothetical protein